MQYNVEDVLQAQVDLLGLLGFELELQNPVDEKIQGFMARIAHRAIIALWMCKTLQTFLSQLFKHS